jgi:DNA-binding NtrC family response regulator
LNILSFRLPPLRERPFDIEYLARKFALEHSRTHNIQIRVIEPGFLDALRRYPWPGNIREMENVVRRAVLYCQRGVLSVKDLPSNIRAATQGPVRSNAFTGAPGGYSGVSLPQGYSGITPGAPVLAPQIGPNGHGMGNYNQQAMAYANSQAPNGYYANAGYNYGTNAPSYAGGYASDTGPYANTNAAMPVAALPTPASATQVRPSHTLETRVDVIEQRIIEDTLRRNNHRRKETAAELGISRVTLYNKMKKFGLL